MTVRVLRESRSAEGDKQAEKTRTGHRSKLIHVAGDQLNHERANGRVLSRMETEAWMRHARHHMCVSRWMIEESYCNRLFAVGFQSVELQGVRPHVEVAG